MRWNLKYSKNKKKAEAKNYLWMEVNQISDFIEEVLEQLPKTVKEVEFDLYIDLEQHVKFKLSNKKR